ncbi:ABC-type microcin C transport system permease subunit YejB [Flavobacterium sp. CG_23.5]|uniref:hypothetical protein n=1 Tax=Flavobacterium sp. CG_23.5 TaxID=2760708 RepID=UPI001AE8143D|nr:hypothetical protein [Flavobacterium sp. CG_23.5]MBP2282656.1 ABC-type microcin C transport system permease subunit YejB [Flavobacterium sp. CG_23.5]
MNLKNTLSNYSAKPNSIFKKIFVTFSFAYLPFLILFVILVSFGLMPVNFNNEDFNGIKGVAVLVCFAPIFTFMFSAFAYLWFVFGNFVLKLFVTLLPDKK